jgi:hypothetical protein
MGVLDLTTNTTFFHFVASVVAWVHDYLYSKKFPTHYVTKHYNFLVLKALPFTLIEGQFSQWGMIKI